MQDFGSGDTSSNLVGGMGSVIWTISPLFWINNEPLLFTLRFFGYLIRKGCSLFDMNIPHFRRSIDQYIKGCSSLLFVHPCAVIFL